MPCGGACNKKTRSPSLCNNFTQLRDVSRTTKQGCLADCAALRKETECTSVSEKDCVQICSPRVDYDMQSCPPVSRKLIKSSVSEKYNEEHPPLPTDWLDFVFAEQEARKAAPAATTDVEYTLSITACE